MGKGDYIKLSRKIFEWGWYKNTNTFKVFIHCLLKANWKESIFMGQVLKRGSFATSNEHIALEAGLTVQNVRTALKNLQRTGEILIKSTNKYSVISIVNYDSYQSAEEKLTNNQQTTNTQTYTSTNNNRRSKEVKNIKSIDNIQSILSIPESKKTKKSKQANLEEVIKELDLSSEWKDVFDKWLTYKKEEHNETYKSNTTLKTCIKKVFQECNGSLLKAKMAIENSIAHTWKGIIVQTNNYQTQPRPVMSAPKLEYI